jgi:hypothetical protein
VATIEEVDLIIGYYNEIQQWADEILEMVENEDLMDAKENLEVLSGIMFHAARILENRKRESEEA